MKELVEYIAKNLVDNPEEISVVDVTDEEGVIVYEVSCNPDEKGKLIGKSGRTAKAIRTLVRACSARHGKRATVEIV
ncbi:MAG: KH domain-containing protein [Firmicutes bacterium]|nr:KH domain-containing protein [Bacillota bacterium]NLS44143.1 KH domain-containing protein [Bacillota bacterium]